VSYDWKIVFEARSNGAVLLRDTLITAGTAEEAIQKLRNSYDSNSYDQVVVVTLSVGRS